MSSKWTEWAGPVVVRCSLGLRGEGDVNPEVEDLMGAAEIVSSLEVTKTLTWLQESHSH